LRMRKNDSEITANFGIPFFQNGFHNVRIQGGYNQMPKRKRPIIIGLLIALILVVTYFPSSAEASTLLDDPPPMVTLTPGNPGGDHKMPIFDLGTKEEIMSKFGMPTVEEMRLNSKIDFAWDLNNWLNFAESSRAGVIFSWASTWGIFAVIFILMLVFVAIRNIANSVYSAGSGRLGDISLDLDILHRGTDLDPDSYDYRDYIDWHLAGLMWGKKDRDRSYGSLDDYLTGN